MSKLQNKKLRTEPVPFPSFPKYTWEMYDGNKPAGQGNQSINGYFFDRWATSHGGGETHGSEIIHANFSINSKITIYITGNRLWISNMKYAGDPRIWQYCYNHDGMPTGACYCRAHILDMENEEVEKILNTKIENCRFWDLVRNRAMELYLESGKINHSWKDRGD